MNIRTNTAKVRKAVRNNVELILANHNPKSGKLHQILSDPAVAEYARAAHYDLRFFVASFCGYGMYSATMYDLDAFRKLVRLQLE